MFNVHQALTKQNMKQDNTGKIGDFYNWIRDYWGELSRDPGNGFSGLLNFGCWDTKPANLYKAQDRLFDVCVEGLRPFHANTKGLEVGCGIGGNSLRLCLKEPVRMTAIDISEEQLKIAQQLAIDAGCEHKIRYMFGDSMEMPFEAEMFDFSICIESTFHYSAIDRFVAEQVRVLKPGAMAVIADITCEKVSKVRFQAGNNFYSVDYMAGLLESSGLEILNLNRIGAYVFEPLYKYVRDYNVNCKLKVAKYWNLVLYNYANLAQKGLMGYDIYLVKKPRKYSA